MRALACAGLLALLMSLPCDSRAAWRCVDRWHNVYITSQQLDQAEVQCAWFDRPGDAASPSAFDAAPLVRGVLSLSPPLRRLAPMGRRPSMAAMATYRPLIDSVALAYGQDAALVRAIVQVESSFNPKAVSSKGAIGLMQVMPATASMLGLVDPKQRLFEPESNLRTGVQFLRNLLTEFSGDVELAVAAYNAGPEAVRRHGYAVPDFPETREYVRNVMTLYRRPR